MTDFQNRVQSLAETNGITSPLVFGEGLTCSPRLMLIGEAPGGQEEAQGRPFVGKAGKNLDRFLEVLGIHRESIYITNAVKFRPIRVSPKGTVSNRTPTRTECALFLPLLREEIQLIVPRMIVTLGNTPLSQLLPDRKTIGDVHGTPIQIYDPIQTVLFPLYHPAAIIYNRSISETYESDLLRLRDYLKKNIPDN